jgi:acetylornithine deacetylase/succinyl-diaminopimelate desuccinylase-like protein
MLWFLAASVLWMQTPNAVREWRLANEKAILTEFTELVRLPNVASDTLNIRKNGERIRDLLAQRGVEARLLESAPAPPVVFGEILTPGATRTIIFYAHYDGQPVDAKQWSTPPWEPVMRRAAVENGGQQVDWQSAPKIDPEWRLFARAVADDKAPIQAMLSALDALRAGGRKPKSNIKFFLEGEEEAGSPHLEQFARKYANLLSGDVWLICDGPVHQNRRQSLAFGVRGVTGAEITVYGPRRELHSGHYGNWAPNPAMMLSRLLATMTDGEGRVMIDGFYDGIVPLSAGERSAIDAAPQLDELLKEELDLARADGNDGRLLDLINRPSLNIRGLESASVSSGARNVVPAQASASLDLRLVKGTDHRAQIAKLTEHIRKQGYYVTAQEPTREERRRYAKIARVRSDGGYNAVRTSMELPICREVIQTMEALHGPLVLLPTHGGSVPLWVFEEVLKTPLILVPTVNHDNNQHSHNENLRLQNLWDGIETMAALLLM